MMDVRLVRVIAAVSLATACGALDGGPTPATASAQDLFGLWAVVDDAGGTVLHFEANPALPDGSDVGSYSLFNLDDRSGAWMEAETGAYTVDGGTVTLQRQGGDATQFDILALSEGQLDVSSERAQSGRRQYTLRDRCPRIAGDLGYAQAFNAPGGRDNGPMGIALTAEDIAHVSVPSIPAPGETDPVMLWRPRGCGFAAIPVGQAASMASLRIDSQGRDHLLVPVHISAGGQFPAGLPINYVVVDDAGLAGVTEEATGVVTQTSNIMVDLALDVADVPHGIVHDASAFQTTIFVRTTASGWTSVVVPQPNTELSFVKAVTTPAGDVEFYLHGKPRDVVGVSTLWRGRLVDAAVQLDVVLDLDGEGRCTAVLDVTVDEGGTLHAVCRGDGPNAVVYGAVSNRAIDSHVIPGGLHPQLAIGPRGVVHVTYGIGGWTRIDGGTIVARPLTGADTFNGGEFGQHLRPDIVVDSQGRAHIAHISAGAYYRVNIEQPTRPVSLQVSVAGSGTVSSDAPLFECRDLCSVDAVIGQRIEVSLQPDPGFAVSTRGCHTVETGGCVNYATDAPVTLTHSFVPVP